MTTVRDYARTQALLQRASFLASYPEVRQLPSDNGLEIAFAGRSNTGKSSALNVLCTQKHLARTSRTPGRTQHLVVFDLDGDRRLVDLPGFGYAKVSKTMRAHWDAELPRYLETRRALGGMILLMDARHTLNPLECQIIDWCALAEVALHVLVNKADKLSRGAGAAALHGVQRRLDEAAGGATAQLFSALKRDGLEKAWQRLDTWLWPGDGAPDAATAGSDDGGQ